MSKKSDPQKNCAEPEQSDGYAVGYGKPPKHSRFQPGQSGNRKGRPRGAQNVQTVLLAELSETITATQDGRTVKMTKLEALIRSSLNRGIKGEARAATVIFNLMERHGVAVAPATDETGPLGDADRALLASLIADLKPSNDDGEA